MQLDHLDRLILEELIQDGDMSVPVMAKKINFSSTVIYSRISRLISNGIIKRFTIDINYKALGFEISGYVGLVVNIR